MTMLGGVCEEQKVRAGMILDTMMAQDIRNVKDLVAGAAFDRGVGKWTMRSLRDVRTRET